MKENQNIRQEIDECEKLLIGLGEEWRAELVPDLDEGYGKLAELTEGKDFFLVTTVTDSRIFESGIEAARIVAPCGNETWLTLLYEGYLGAGGDSGGYLPPLRRSAYGKYHSGGNLY